MSPSFRQKKNIKIYETTLRTFYIALALKDSVFNIIKYVQLCSWNGGHLPIETTQWIALNTDEKILCKGFFNVTKKRSYIKCFSAHFAYSFEQRHDTVNLQSIHMHKSSVSMSSVVFIWQQGLKLNFMLCCNGKSIFHLKSNTREKMYLIFAAFF